MNLLERVAQFFSRKTQRIEVSADYCPNCWGKQEYGGQFYEAVQKEIIDLNNVTQKKGWIQAYALEHFEGIKLKKVQNGMECTACKTTYRPANA